MLLEQLHYLNQLEHLAFNAAIIKPVPVSYTDQLRHHKMRIQYLDQEAHMQPLS